MAYFSKKKVKVIKISCIINIVGVNFAILFLCDFLYTVNTELCKEISYLMSTNNCILSLVNIKEMEFIFYQKQVLIKQLINKNEGISYKMK